MQPENKKAIKKSKGEARVKTLIRAHLYWLSGFPYLMDDRVYWCCPSYHERDKHKIIITPKMISKAHRVINELCRDYPKALPRIVGDVVKWEKRNKTYLEFTKSQLVTTNNKSLNSLFDKDHLYRAKYSKQFSDEVLTSDLAIAMSWMHYVSREELTRSLEFIVGHTQNFQGDRQHDIILLSKLCHVFVVSVGKSSGFLRLYLMLNNFTTSTVGGRAYISPYIQYRYNPKKNKESKKFELPIKPPENTSKHILHSINWILEFNSNQRKRALVLFDCLELDKLIRCYQNSWLDIDRLITKISNHINYPNINSNELLSELQCSLDVCLSQHPKDIEISSIFTAIQKFSRSEILTKAACSFLHNYSKYKHETSLKISFLILFENCLFESDKSEKYVAEYINHFAKYINHSTCSEILSPWSNLRGNYWSSCESDIFDNLKISQLGRFFETLSVVTHELGGEVSKDSVYGITMIVAAGFSVDTASKLVIALIKKEKIDVLSKTVLKIAYEQNLCFEKIEKLVGIWNKLDEEYTDDDTLGVIYKTFSRIDGAEILNDFIFSEKISVLRHCSNQVRVICKICDRENVPILKLISEDMDDWIRTYPDEYHTHLAKLNSVTKSAEKISRKIFHANWWPKSFIELELKEVKTRLKNCDTSQEVNIKRRIVNLTNKLAKHSPASKVIQEKIRKRLKNRIKKEQFDLWRTELEKHFKKSWAVFLDITEDPFPNELLNEEMVRYLLPVADFNLRNKSLAKLVIRQRYTTNDWLFKKHPKNKTFLRELSEQGFNTQAWLEGIGKEIYKTKSSKEITINEVIDPIEILNMGGHFKTCLSPGSFNYFSVFANIADINKRVIYGKNSDGKVIGRVLIGLMSSGGVKVFNIYSHNVEDEFKSQVMTYIKSWVELAGFTLTDAGEIPKLVATEWYDDGAINVDNNIACLKDDSSFRRRLKKMVPSDFEYELTNALNPLPINELTIPLVANLPEIKMNPHLIPPLVKIARTSPRLSVYDKIRLFYLADEGQAGEQCYQAFRRDLVNELLISIRVSHWVDSELAFKIATYNPSDALRVIKKLGNCWPGNWQDNLFGSTARVAIKSLRMLGRVKQSDALAKKYGVNVEEIDGIS